MEKVQLWRHHRTGEVFAVKWIKNVGVWDVWGPLTVEQQTNVCNGADWQGRISELRTAGDKETADDARWTWDYDAPSYEVVWSN